MTAVITQFFDAGRMSLPKDFNLASQRIQVNTRHFRSVSKSELSSLEFKQQGSSSMGSIPDPQWQLHRPRAVTRRVLTLDEPTAVDRVSVLGWRILRHPSIYH